MKHLYFTTPITVVISLLALVGVTLHDTRLDKLATNLIGAPGILATADASHRSFGSDGHTHVERMNIGELRNQLPRLTPRASEDKRYVMQRSLPTGGNPFDGCFLPLA